MKRIKFSLVMLIAFISLISNPCLSQPFTPGNIVVVRLGDGTMALNNTAGKVFLDEFSTTGSLIQSIALPVTLSGGNKIFTLPANSSVIGSITLSPDCKTLCAIGYNAVLGTDNTTLNNTTSIDRTIVIINSNSQINTATSIPGPEAASGTPFSAITYNGSIWATSSNGGLRFIPVGGLGSNSITTGTTFRTLSINNNQLYVTSNTGRVLVVGSGLPTTGPQTNIMLPNIPSNGVAGQCQFFLADLNPNITGPDVIYVAHDGTPALQKYSFDGSTWISNGLIGSTSDDFRYITGSIQGTKVTLYVTKLHGTGAAGGGQLIKLTDTTGHNLNGSSFSGLSANVIVLANAANQTAFRGVAMVPVKCKAPDLLFGATTPTSVQVFITDSLVGNNYEYEISSNSVPPATGTTTNNNIISSNTLNPGNHYYVHVRRNCGAGIFSLWTTIDFTTAWPPCVTPSGINAVFNGDSTTIKWNGVFTAIKYEYALTDKPDIPVSGIFLTNTDVVIKSLLSSKPYYFHIRTYCGGGDTSSWISYPFSTPCFAPSPYFISNNLEAGTAELEWKGEAGIQHYEYAILTEKAPINGSKVITNDTLISINGLKPGNRYYLHVRKRCSGSSISQWRVLEFNVSGVHVFPNPAKNSVSITVYGQDGTGQSVYVYDNNGHLIAKPLLIGNNVIVNTATWPAGIYYVRFGNGKGYVTRIIKQ